MIPAGYLAKRIVTRPDWLKAVHVEEILSLSGCVSENFTNYLPFWKHNGFWLFDSPEAIQVLAAEQAIDLSGCRFFYYEAYELEFDGEEKQWHGFGPEKSLPTAVQPWEKKELAGFDVVTFSSGTAPECSPLSCNSLAETLPVNRHCLFDTFEMAKQQIDAGGFEHSEPGPYRIFSVYACGEE